MRMYDLIVKKRDGHALNTDEIAFFVKGVTDGAFPDEQISAFLMAVFFRGMTDAETAALTVAMARSGMTVDLSGIDGVKADKHSTGGVGDKTTLVVAPIVAACGVKVAKMSGKGLGHTGGTVDKLASIPGFKTELPQETFFRIVREQGLCVAGQSGDLAPADKKLYALRDVTGTVDSLPLIAASIMSKKLAAGADCILLDVKTGSGAFMKKPEDAIQLAQAMVAIGESAGKNTVALITGMDRPLGYAIGNALEVIEAAETLQGRGRGRGRKAKDYGARDCGASAYGTDGVRVDACKMDTYEVNANEVNANEVGVNAPEDLYALCINLAAHMLWQAGKGALPACRLMAEEAVASGAAFKRLCAMVAAQGGDASALTDYERLPQARVIHSVYAKAEGFIQAMDTAEWGIASMKLGAGRETKESAVDYGAGILLRKKVGDYVRVGDELAVFYTNNEKRIPDAEETVLNTCALTIGSQPPEKQPLVYARVDKSGVHAITD